MKLVMSFLAPKLKEPGRFMRFFGALSFLLLLKSLFSLFFCVFQRSLRLGAVRCGEITSTMILIKLCHYLFPSDSSLVERNEILLHTASSPTVSNGGGGSVSPSSSNNVHADANPAVFSHRDRRQRSG